GGRRQAGGAGAYVGGRVPAAGPCAGAPSLLALGARFSNLEERGIYLLFACGLPVLWCAAVAIAGGYDSRFIGLGSDEFRRVLNAAVSLTAGLALVAYATKIGIARGVMAVALPGAAAFDRPPPSVPPKR